MCGGLPTLLGRPMQRRRALDFLYYPGMAPKGRPMRGGEHRIGIILFFFGAALCKTAAVSSTTPFPEFVTSAYKLFTAEAVSTAPKRIIPQQLRSRSYKPSNVLQFLLSFYFPQYII